MELVYPTFTAAMLVASLVCLRDAWGDREATVLYATAVVYGFVMEKLVIVAFDAYTYPAAAYVVDALGVPWAIALGWSAVIYAGVTTARGLGLSRAGVPAFAAVYALHVDLSMDAIAIRVPFWTWHDPGPWFGVPLGNFFGWFWVAAFLPAWLAWLRGRIDHPVARGGTALAASVASLLVVLEAWTRFATSVAVEAAVLGACIAVAVGVVVASRPRTSRRPPATAFAATLVFHAFFLGVAVWFGFYRATPALLVLGAAALLVGVGVHVLPGRADRSTGRNVETRSD